MFVTDAVQPLSAGFSRLATGLAALIVAFALVFLPAGQADAKPKFSAIAVDARTGAIYFSSDPDGLRYPASLTKMMTLYVLFQDLKAGRIKLTTQLRVSARAANMAPSKLGFKPGQTISVDNAIKALVTKSANDVASAIGENLGGSEANFAARMTRVARSLGMRRTTFKNASGLPNPGQVTTARDIATLSLRLMRDFPQYYPYFRLQSFNYKGRVIRSHNRLVGKYPGADGLKTGYIAAAGFNLATSARRDGKRLVGVVLGAKSTAARNAYMMKMLDKAFPKAKSGKVIVAKPGSSAGAVDPIAGETPVADAQKPAGKKKLKPLFGKKKAQEPAEEAAAPLDSGQMADATAEAAQPQGTASQTVIAPEDQQQTQVLEAKLSDDSDEEAAEGAGGDQQTDTADASAAPSETTAKAVPKTLPFAVKQPGTEAAPGEVQVASIPSSWNIQIGAYPNKRDAQAKLNDARAAGVDLLKGKTALTVQVQKGNETIYRARFSGFTEKDAYAACAQLKKRGQKCMALAPQS
jgi:D-alanyl-D-alanine carboxypeptidase